MFYQSYQEDFFDFGNDIGTVLESLKEFDLNQLKSSLSISVSVDEGV